MMVLEDFQNEWNLPKDKCKIIFTAIFKHRDVSDYVSEKTGMPHHSPQVFLFDNGEIKYHKTQLDIKVFEIKELVLK